MQYMHVCSCVFLKAYYIESWCYYCPVFTNTAESSLRINPAVLNHSDDDGSKSALLSVSVTLNKDTFSPVWKTFIRCYITVYTPQF